MCCRRRNRRGPLVVIAAQAAYGKYQEHQLKKQRPELDALSAPTAAPVNDSNTSPRIIHSHDEKQDLLMNLDTSGIRPPSYDEVVVNRAEIPDHSPKDSADAAGVEQAAEDFVTNWKRERNGSSTSEGEEGMTWWEMKKAAKQAKKEAKYAKKAAKWEAKGKKNGFCC